MSQITPYIKSTTPSLVLAVTNDLVTDNRVHKIATTLTDMGFEVTVVGRLLQASSPLQAQKYSSHRMQLWFNKGPLFYANYNISLFFYLLFKRFNVIVANDLDSLLGCFVAKEITRSELVYDSHEYFTEVPELSHRPFIKKRWEEIEQAIVPKLKHCYTVCQSIATIYNQKYGSNFKVVRNLPFRKKKDTTKQITPPFATDLPVILYQGAINYGRGIEEAILAMHQVNNARLVLIGGGDEFEKCQLLVKKEQLQHKVTLTGRVPFQQLKDYTELATIGLSIEKDIGLNYRYALPNKLFDYIQSNVPVLTCELPEIKNIIATYRVGKTIEEVKPDQISKAINEMLDDTASMKQWKANCEKAAAELCWENEEKVLQSIYQQFL